MSEICITIAMATVEPSRAMVMRQEEWVQVKMGSSILGLLSSE